MRNLEVVQELRTRVKAYSYVDMPQSTYSRILSNIENGITKPKTMKVFFEKFGYQGSFNDWAVTPGYVIPTPSPKSI